MRDSTDRLPTWRRYLRFWGSDVSSDVRDEIAFHIEALTAEYLRAGMDPSAAQAAAIARFGNTAEIAHTMRMLANQRDRQMQRTEWVDALYRDFRFALRQLGKRRGFTVVALATLALGIGANTAIFSAVNTILLHPIAAPDLDRIAVVRTNLPTMNLMDAPLGPGEAIDVMNRNDLFDASGSWAGRGLVLTGRGEARRLAATRTLGNFFDVFHVRPALGRLYRAEESENGQHHVVVLSHGLWTALGADRGIVGQLLQLNGESFQVVGVMPATFDYPRGTEVYLPMPLDAKVALNRSTMIFNVVGRRKADVTAAQLDAGVASETRRWHQHPGWSYAKLGQFMNVIPLTTVLAGQLRPVLLVLLGAVGFVLLIACANVASLQLVHATTRSKELAVRAALGAGRATIARQLLVENLVLSLGGGLLGVGVGRAILALLVRAGAGDMPALQHVALDGTALGFAALTTLAAALLFGTVPALRASRVDLNETLKESTRGSSLGARKNRLLKAGVVGQVALSLILLLGAGLMIRSLSRLLAQRPGFDPEQVVALRTIAAGQRYANGPALTAFYTDLVNRLRATPGVGDVGLVSELPFSNSNDSSPFRIIGRAPDPNGPEMHANLHTVSEGYFATMRIPLLQGRAFTAADDKNSQNVVVIDAQLAKQFFPNENPIGKRINQGPDGTIIGVVGSVSQNELGEPAKATIYWPTRQSDWNAALYVVVRSALPTSTVATAARAAVAAIDPAVPVFELRTLDDRISASLAPQRLAMSVLTSLAALSLLLSVLGLYGVISYAVSQRITEFGIRAALGAEPRQVRGLVVRQGLGLALAGVVIGVIGATLATRALSALLFGVSPRDPVTFVAAAVLVTVIAIGASYAPARRATRMNLVDALRAP